MSIHLQNLAQADAAAESSQRTRENNTRAESRARPAIEIPVRPGSEHYDTLLWRLSARRPDAFDNSFVLGIVGSKRQAGASTLATNLAIRAADHGLGPVLLVDANIARPQLHRLWNVPTTSGLADVLAGQLKLAACLQQTAVVGLDLLPLGDARRLDHARVDPVWFEGAVVEMREKYSTVICDLADPNSMGHGLLLAAALDAALLVVRAGRMGRHAAQQAANRLAADGIHVIGAVITDHRPSLPNWLEQRL